MCNKRCFTGRKEREVSLFAKLTRQEKTTNGYTYCSDNVLSQKNHMLKDENPIADVSLPAWKAG